MLVLAVAARKGAGPPWGRSAFATHTVWTWSKKLQNDNWVRKILALQFVWIETLQSSLCELRLPRHVGILWKELKWQITQFSSFLANKFVWMTCNSLCLWMRAFNLNISVLIRKRRLGDNDICWLWKEKTSNQHILTRQRLCFLAVHHFHFALKLWTCNVKKRAQKILPARTATLW